MKYPYATPETPREKAEKYFKKKVKEIDKRLTVQSRVNLLGTYMDVYEDGNSLRRLFIFNYNEKCEIRTHPKDTEIIPEEILITIIKDAYQAYKLEVIKEKLS